MYRANESLSSPPIHRGGAAGHYPFKIDQLEYGLHIGESGSVWLDLVGGVTRKGSADRNPCKDLFWDEPNFSDVDLGVNAFKVFRTAGQLLLNHIFSKRPGRIGLVASTSRKARVFRRLAQRLALQLKNYTFVEYPVGTFNFYRLVDAAYLDEPAAQCRFDQWMLSTGLTPCLEGERS